MMYSRSEVRRERRVQIAAAAAALRGPGARARQAPAQRARAHAAPCQAYWLVHFPHDIALSFIYIVDLLYGVRY